MSKISEANKHFRKGDYQTALIQYEKIASQNPTAARLIKANIELSKSRLNGKAKPLSAAQYQPQKLIATDATPRIVTGTSKDYEGKLEKVDDGNFKGWVVSKKNPGATVEIDVLLDGTLFKKEKNAGSRQDLARHGKSKGLGGFSFSIPGVLLDQPRHKVELRFPDGVLFAQTEIDGQKEAAKPVPTWVPVNEPVSVIVPIYNALDDVKVCIERLIQYTSKDTDIILINDASPDPEIAKHLESIELPENFRIFHNEQNLGFTKTVNKGIKLAGDNDVVLLNSDARVTPRWLIGMKRALARDARIATVTPMSDRAGAFSAPNIGNDNELPAGVTEESYALAFRRRSVGYYPTVPTGNGFCMYIRRAAINEVGLLDEEAFPRGYGEENDFCMRARAKGWRSVIDDRTYVFHDRNKSFGDQKTNLVTDGRKVLDARYPDYGKAISVFRDSEQIKSARYLAGKALEDCDKVSLPRVMYVISTVTGGTPQTNRDLMLALEGTIEPWLFRCDSKVMTLWKVGESQGEIIASHTLQEPVDPLTHRSHEYDAIINSWLEMYDFEIVHIRHLAWHSLSLPRLAKNQGAKVIKSFHDFYTVCPTVKLIDAEGRYCQGQCSSLTSNDCNFKLWPENSLPTLKNGWVKKWQEQFREALKFCDAYVTTSDSARDTVAKSLNLPDNVPFEVIGHGRDFKEFRAPDIDRDIKGKVKVVFPGNLDSEKGLDEIKSLLSLDKENNLELHILGKCSENLKDPRVIHHGEYRREEFVEKIKKINPHVGAVLSVWDETWCHTLTELWASGVPVAVFDFCTVATRVRDAGAGWVCRDVTDLYSLLLALLKNPKEYKQRCKSVLQWQEGTGSVQNVLYMSVQYLNLYKGHKGTDIGRFVSVVSPASRDLKSAPGSTYVRVWEKTRNSLGRKLTYLRQTPEQLLAALEAGLVSKALIQRNAISKDLWERIKIFVSDGDLDYVFDIDDDLFDVPRDKDPNRFYEGYRDTLTDIVKRANKVLVSTPALKDKVNYFNSSTIVEPNRLSFHAWGLEGKCVNSYDRSRYGFLYYGSMTHEEDFQLVLPTLKVLYEKYPDFRVYLVGVSEASHDLPFVVNVKIPDDSKNYPEFVDFLKSVAKKCCLGIAPLNGREFNTYKSDLKIREYLGLGLPVLASNFGPYASAEYNSRVGLVSDNAWYESLENFIELGVVNGAKEAGNVPLMSYFSEQNFDVLLSD